MPGLGNRCGRIAEAERDLVAVVEDIVDGEPDETADRLGIEKDQHGGDPFHQRKVVAGHDLADQGNAPVLADRGRVLGADDGNL
jgi:hypothetical protein